MAEQKTKYTQEGYQKLIDELEYLKITRRQEVKELLKEARSFGDLSENSEYDEAKNQQAQVEHRIAELEFLIKNGEVVSEETIDKNVVSIGSTVTIKYEDGREVTYHIVSSNEVAPLEKKISDLSPIGSALVGHKKGETVTIVTPAGEKDAKIVSFERTKK
ncbi:MAG: transcription elongation factor GreA [Clostridia bacterium]|nr:transcription elongation factor GreA [Clostridia bacterium]MBR2943622.1 transcription elongation factor GreA [Clostridia bacterium]